MGLEPKVTQVVDRDPAAGGGDEQLRSQYAQAWSNAEAQAYLGALKTRHKVSLKTELIEAAASSPAR